MQRTETLPLLNDTDELTQHDMRITVNYSSSSINTLENITQDNMNLISTYLCYQPELINLRLTSKQLDQLIERTSAGIAARDIHDFERSCIVSFIQDNKCIRGGIGMLIGSSIGATLPVAVMYCIASIMHVSAFSYFPILLWIELGSILAAGALGANISEYTISTSRNAFFNRQLEIRQALSEPVLALTHRV
jgi:hypothetical protein